MSVPVSGFHCSMCRHLKAIECTLECSCCCVNDDEYFGTDENSQDWLKE